VLMSCNSVIEYEIHERLRNSSERYAFVTLGYQPVKME